MELLKGKLSLPSHVGGGSNVLSIYYFYILIFFPVIGRGLLIFWLHCCKKTLGNLTEQVNLSYKNNSS